MSFFNLTDLLLVAVDQVEHTFFSESVLRDMSLPRLKAGTLVKGWNCGGERKTKQIAQLEALKYMIPNISVNLVCAYFANSAYVWRFNV